MTLTTDFWLLINGLYAACFLDTRSLTLRMSLFVVLCILYPGSYPTYIVIELMMVLLPHMKRAPYDPESPSIWSTSQLELEEFTFNACYLRVKDEQQRVHISSETDDSDDDEAEADPAYFTQLKQVLYTRQDIERGFVDSIAELFAREKPLTQGMASVINRNARSPDTANQVTAAALLWFSPEGITQIVMAKNGGFDQENNEFAALLLMHLRAWPEDRETRDGLVKAILHFARSRLEYYIAHMCLKHRGWTKFASSLLTRNPNDPLRVKTPTNEISRLFSLCAQYEATAPSSDEETQLLHDITALAYHLREGENLSQVSKILLNDNSIQDRRYMQKLVLEISYLGRVQDEISCLEAFANFHKAFKIELRLFTPPPVPRIDLAKLRLRAEALPQGSHTRAQLLEQFDAGSDSPRNLWKVHCEMQVLLWFEKQGTRCQNNYIGISIKSCWMCQVILERYHYQPRGFHGRRVGLWILDSATPSSVLIDAVGNLQRRMRDTAFRLMRHEELFLAGFVENYTQAAELVEKSVKKLQGLHNRYSKSANVKPRIKQRKKKAKESVFNRDDNDQTKSPRENSSERDEESNKDDIHAKHSEDQTLLDSNPALEDNEGQIQILDALIPILKELRAASKELKKCQQELWPRIETEPQSDDGGDRKPRQRFQRYLSRDRKEAPQYPASSGS